MTNPALNTGYVAYNGMVPAKDAADNLGCVYSHIINLIKSKKLKGQKIENRWFVEAKDLERAKATRLVRPRKRAAPTILPMPTPTAESTKLQIEVPKEKLEIIKLAFRKNGDTLAQHLSKHLDEIYNKVLGQLDSISL